MPELQLEPHLDGRAEVRLAEDAAVEHTAGSTPTEAWRAARDIEREELHESRVPAWEGATEGLDPAAHLLVLRSRALLAPAAGDELSRFVLNDDDSLLVKALWCEIALDRLVLTGILEVQLPRFLHLIAFQESLENEPSDLARLTLERAARAGALTDETSTLLTLLRRAHPVVHAPRANGPIDEVWRVALQRALAQAQRESGAPLPSAASAQVFKNWLALGSD